MPKKQPENAETNIDALVAGESQESRYGELEASRAATDAATEAADCEVAEAGDDPKQDASAAEETPTNTRAGAGIAGSEDPVDYGAENDLLRQVCEFLAASLNSRLREIPADSADALKITDWKNNISDLELFILANGLHLKNLPR